MSDCASVFETAWGWCAALWTPAGLAAFELPAADSRAASERIERRVLEIGRVFPAPVRLHLRDDPAEALPRDAAQAVEAARAWFEGREVDLRCVRVTEPYGASPFRRRVWKALRGTRRGETLTYGELARRAGNPGAARAAGTAAGANPAPLFVPCHRVVPAGGGLGGFSAAEGPAMKRRMLVLEGVVRR